MATLTIPQTSIQYVQQQLTYTVSGASADPTGYPVACSFVPQPTYGAPPDPSSWTTAAWETDPGPLYWGSILIGTTSNGGILLAKGAYLLAWQITTPVEIPVIWGVSVLIT